MGVRVARVERHISAARGDHAEQGDDHVGAVIEDQGYRRRIVGAQRQDGVGDRSDPGSEFRVGQRALPVAQGDSLGVDFHHVREPRDQRALDLVLGK